MAKGPKGFSEQDKEVLRQRLCSACEESWAKHGYKKTTVGELTRTIGVATGSFYLLFSSKEELFHNTFIRVQDRLRRTWQEGMDRQPDKAGFKKMMLWLYREYSMCPFLYDFANPDFLALLNRFTDEQKKSLDMDSMSFFDYTLAAAHLELKVPKQQAYAAFSTLLYTVSFQENCLYDHFAVFELLLESAIHNILK